MPPKKTKPSSPSKKTTSGPPALNDPSGPEDLTVPSGLTIESSTLTSNPPGLMKMPLLINSLTPKDLESYRFKIRNVLPEYSIDDPKYEIVYKIRDDKPADYTRAIQEPEILKTRLKLKDTKTGRTIQLKSFAEIWEDPKSGLAEEILSAKDPNEAKWELAKKYNYKIATTFIPMYAKSIYEYFDVQKVLDPCAGWGDRMVGALTSTCVKKYVGFDPNQNLVPGYKRIQQDFGNGVSIDDPDNFYVKFKNGYEIYSIPFENSGNSKRFADEKFDFAFTSPPFFDYEEYNPENPTYRNWYREFYEPLFTLTESRLRENSFFAIHIDDTSAGKIRDFLFLRVEQITSFKYCGKIGLVGGKSGKTRNVYIFQKTKADD